MTPIQSILEWIAQVTKQVPGIFGDTPRAISQDEADRGITALALAVNALNKGLAPDIALVPKSKPC